MAFSGLMNTLGIAVMGAAEQIDPAALQFKLHVQLAQFTVPAISSGILLMGFILFAYMYVRSREPLHLAMLLLAFIGAFFVFSELMVLASGGFLRNWGIGVQFHRLEQIFASFFLFGMPFLLSKMLTLNERWKKLNAAIAWTGFALACAFTAVSFIVPDLFVSQTIHRPNWLIDAADHGRGMEGPLYVVRDGLLALLIIYLVVCFITDMVWHRRFRYLLPSFIGILIAIYGAVIDVISVYAYSFYDFFPESRHSRFTLGITLYILFSMGSVFRKFFDMGHEVELAHEEARREAEKNLAQNTFMRDVLRAGSGELVTDMESLSSTIAAFTENSQEESAATEEVSAAIEEITAGVDSVKSSADEQYRSIESLSSTMGALSASITAMNSIVQDSLGVMKQISDNAKSGEQSLSVMNESMKNISGSSREITGIVQIINDISDRINLLSLNAAIEAARAGDAGRGFAVVADEISKLADQTATSIKNIDDLIRTNERDIGQGIQNIGDAVGKIDAIIDGMESIVGKINAISAQMNEQTAANSIVNENSELVKSKSEHIMNAMSEQRNAMDEISKTIAAINELSQANTHRILEITGSSKSLVGKVAKLNDEIEKHSGE
jgi:methyl-accepting chemotaxis protein